MTLEETLIAVRGYNDNCRKRNLENHTSYGVEVDPHTLTWVVYWLTKMSEKEKKNRTANLNRRLKWMN